MDTPSYKMSIKRLEYERMKNPDLILSPLQVLPNKRLQWILQIPGPIGSPYEGNIYDLEIQYAPLYPYSAPYTQFRTPIFHPNITPNGLMSNLMTEAWGAYNTVRTIYETATDILATPLKEYPYNNKALELWGTPAFQQALLAFHTT